MKIPPVEEMIGELVAIPSISSNNPQIDQSNGPITELLATWCSELGFECEILPVPDYPGKFNLLATLGHGDNGLVLSGHTDTVPYDLDGWQSNPFKLVQRDDRLYGLGTSDMKAFFALSLHAVEQILTDNTLPENSLTILATANEETDMAGARALRGKPKARYALIGEPTGLKPIRMHKGNFMEAICLHGKSGHSSNPNLGRSALEGMYTVIGELLEWRRELQAKYTHSFFEIPLPTLNLGHIRGGDSPNRICADCQLEMDLRLLPGMDFEELRATLHRRVRKSLDNSGLDIEFKTLFSGIPAMETPADSEIVKITENLTGNAARAVAYATEAPYLSALGMETIILGPGDIEQAHQPDEFIAMERLQPMTDILKQLILEVGRL